MQRQLPLTAEEKTALQDLGLAAERATAMFQGAIQMAARLCYSRNNIPLINGQQFNLAADHAAFLVEEVEK